MPAPRPMSKSWLCGLAVVILGAVACGASVASPKPTATPSAVKQATLTIDGLKRTYLLFRPSTRGSLPPAPLLLALHGYFDDASGMELTTSLDDKAATGGFVVVYPEGIDQSWNAGTCCGDAQSRNIDDVSFIRQLIDRLVHDGYIDPKRVFVTGVSNGGMMAYRLGCELSDRIAAVASVSGALVMGACNPMRPISVLEMHGTEDSVVPFNGGVAVGTTPVPPMTSIMAAWASIDGCATGPTVTQSGITKTTEWTSCRGGAVVVLDAVIGAGHGWFGQVGVLGEPSATKVVWDFFSHLPTRP
jgi:polyhydroxybutyrate depolymerase